MSNNMNEENQIPYQGAGSESQPGQTGAGSQSTTDATWEEVGRQFQALGDSLAEAVRAAWQNESTQQTVQEMRTGVEAMVTKVGKAIEDSANSPQGRQIREDAGKAAEALRSAGEQTVQEVRPQLITALEQVNAELQKLINRMEQRSAPAGATAPEDQPPSEPGPGISL